MAAKKKIEVIPVRKLLVDPLTFTDDDKLILASLNLSEIDDFGDALVELAQLGRARDIIVHNIDPHLERYTNIYGGKPFMLDMTRYNLGMIPVTVEKVRGRWVIEFGTEDGQSPPSEPPKGTSPQAG